VTNFATQGLPWSEHELAILADANGDKAKAFRRLQLQGYSRPLNHISGQLKRMATLAKLLETRNAKA